VDPGTPRSEPCAESCQGPKPGGELPTGSPPGNATVDEIANRDRIGNLIGESNPSVQSIVNRYLGVDGSGASTSYDITAVPVQDNNMSVSSVGCISRKRIREGDSDSDVGHRSPRGNRLPLRDFDSDEPEPIEILSDSPVSIKKARAKKVRTRYRDPNASLNADFSHLVFSNCPIQLADGDLIAKDADEIATTANNWLTDMEIVRTKSNQLNGRLSGVLKDRIRCMRTLVKTLVEKVKASGDVSYLRRRNDELSGQLREAKKEEGRLKSFLKESDAKADKLSAELSELRKRMGSVSVESDKPLPQRQPKGRQERHQRKFR